MPSPGTHSYDEVLRTQCGPFEISNAFGMSQVLVALRDEAGTSPHGRSLLPAESLQASRNKPNAVLRGNGSPLHHPACADYLVERRGLDFLTTDARC